MSGPKRNADKLNTIGVVVVGICGAVLVYVSIVALQAFYMNDSSEVQTSADYGGQESTSLSLRATQTATIEDCAPNSKPQPGQDQTYRIPIKYAIKLVADEAKVDPANLVPTQGRSEKSTILPIFGRPKMAKPPTPPATPPGQAPGTVPTGGQGGAGGPNPGGSNPDPGQGSGSSAGGNPPTPDPKAGVSDPKAGTAPPHPETSTTPKTGSAAPKGNGK